MKKTLTVHYSAVKRVKGKAAIYYYISWTVIVFLCSVAAVASILTIRNDIFNLIVLPAVLFFVITNVLNLRNVVYYTLDERKLTWSRIFKLGTREVRFSQIRSVNHEKEMVKLTLKDGGVILLDAPLDKVEFMKIIDERAGLSQ